MTEKVQGPVRGLLGALGYGQAMVQGADAGGRQALPTTPRSSPQLGGSQTSKD
eukprot:CAMPEP_0179365988 /NCGR_PEP_ID=MMETSP0797-20121207/82831_1 /TAXON_ID=47934 /ORGANISM="Dinophysis acuminata, Strain DAEP01" /LENGTH=52 /DNA_ID=CAMNT_0021081501 /DNA_START=14 /DNA_END=173 /DNA_ORIENTATION=-